MEKRESKKHILQKLKKIIKKLNHKIQSILKKILIIITKVVKKFLFLIIILILEIIIMRIIIMTKLTTILIMIKIAKLMIKKEKIHIYYYLIIKFRILLQQQIQNIRMMLLQIH